MGTTVIGKKSFFISSAGCEGDFGDKAGCGGDRYASGSAGTGGEADDGGSVYAEKFGWL